MLRHLALALFAIPFAACIPDPTGTDGGNTGSCPAATGAGTTHATWPTASETWAASGNPHLVTADLKIAKGLKLTLEPCVEVRMSANTHLQIEGDLQAEGTADKPIRIAAVTGQPFGSIVVWAPGTLSLAYATVANGGADTSNSFGAIEARGDQLLPAQEILKVVNTTVSGSVQYGVSLRAGGAFTKTSSGLTVTGSAKAPVRALPRLLSNLPSGLYTGNTLDAVVVETEAYGDVTLEDVAVHDRGVPYVVGGDTSLGAFLVGTGTTSVRLDFDPGVTMKFKKNAAAGLFIDTGSMVRVANGTLVASGTAAKLITFTSAAAVPAAGDWRGLVFGATPTATNKLDNVQVRFAGAPSGANGFHCQPNGAFSANEDAAVAYFGPPPSGALTNSTISDSAGLGVDLAYSGAFVDLVPTNTFNALATCKTSYPRSATGTCPATVPCP